MNKLLLSCLAFIGGAFLAVQASLNANLGVILKKPILASLAQNASGMVFALVIATLSFKTQPSLTTVKQVPAYLWFTGGLFSVLGISLYYFTIPKLGFSTMISLGLSGQLIFAVAASHFGWLNMQIEPLTTKKLLGIVCLLAGILLIKIK
ncbi:DMT family transporter [Pedobacter nutrimenti]|uniref:DMT family transporter n=1 Tax=Pedobacter nutrimenti TaxID=1241337 RepID=UPI00292F699A|nr:DMT family transporter [Pedobacter nutrimenti]